MNAYIHPMHAGTWNVKDHGAKGDGKAPDTAAIQAAIDECSKNGGGTVLVPPGKYLCGTIHLRDDLDLHVTRGATLVASRDDDMFDQREHGKYPDAQGDECGCFHHALLAGDDVTNVRITGGGALDDERHHRHGPKPIALKNSSDITIQDINVYNSPNYAVSLGNCEIVLIDNVRVFYSNADGIDLDSCRSVRITNCHVTSRDDAIVLKGSLAYDEPVTSANIAITSCDLATSCVGFKMGSETNGNFENIVLSNCVIHSLGVARPPLAGFALESVDGARVKGITICNVAMSGMKSPFLIRLGKRLRGEVPGRPGSISDVLINNVTAVNCHFPAVIAGLQEARVERVNLSNIQFEYDYASGGNFAPGEHVHDNGNRPPGTTDILDIPESETRYPDIRMFGDPLPAWAFFARHVSGLHFSNVHCYLNTPDLRPADMLIDVDGAGFEGLHFHKP